MQFRVSSSLKDLIGKDLITNDYIAIFELVKNSYDAYATKVEITFDEDIIIIADNGKGMTFADVRDKWLFLGFSAKKDGSEDDSLNKQESYRDSIKRHYAGAKGIGRISSDRLGSHLNLSTKSNKSSTLEQLMVDWTQFEKDQRNNFTEINIGYNSTTDLIAFPNNKQTGTILEISSLKSNWDRQHILGLKRSLEKLINPLSETTDFSIEINCTRELEKDSKDIKAGLHDREIVNGVLKNSISGILKLKTTQIDVELIEDEIITTIIDRGIDIYKIKEKNTDFLKLEDVKINLYYLNRSAKVNFTKLMGIEPHNYGSIFLFRNGFRILPFGNASDDSWNLDYRVQQGHSRFLGTRDLFGRVDVTTDKVDDLKEVSSRDGGLIFTDTAKQLFAFFEIAHRRLERYVSGVLWGEAFIRREYFKSEIDALNQRKKLLENDKEEEEPNYVLQSSIGSKIDFIQLVKTLTKDKNVEVLYYNKDLANILSDPNQTNSVKPQFIADLEKIAEDTNDDTLLFNIDEAKRRLAELQKEKEIAEEKARYAELKRIEAEEKARLAEIEKKKAEEDRKAEEEAKKIAQFQAKEAELKRREEEIKRKEAEQKQKEETEKRINAEANEAAAIQERDIEKDKYKYLVATRTITKETEDLLHTIQISSNELLSATKSINEIIYNSPIASQVIQELDSIKFHIERINKLSSLLTKADITLLKEYSKVDIPSFIKQYLPNYKVSIKEILFNDSFDEKIIRKIQLLDLSVILDNLISNSKKANADKIFVDFKKINNFLYVDFSDNGDGVDLGKFNSKSIFEPGITNRRGGSGIGLSTIKEAMDKELNGDIEFLGNGLHFSKGATFRLKFR